MPWLTGNSRGPFHEGILEMAYPCGIEGQELVRLDASREAILDAPASSVTGATAGGVAVILLLLASYVWLIRRIISE